MRAKRVNEVHSRILSPYCQVTKLEAEVGHYQKVRPTN